MHITQSDTRRARSKPRPGNPRELHRQHKALLDTYFTERQKNGLGVPQNPRNLDEISAMIISEGTGLPVNVLRGKWIRAYIRKWGEEIGYSEVNDLKAAPTNPTARGERRNNFFRLIGAYIDKLRRAGQKIPESPRAKGKPDLVRIAGESRVPLDSLRRSSAIRKRLDKGIEELGLGIYEYGTEWTTLTYQQLFEAGSEWRKEELAGGKNAAQQLSNTKYALRLFMSNIKPDGVSPLSMEDVVGKEFHYNFEDSVKEVKAAVKKPSSRRKFCGEIGRWRHYYDRQVNTLGLPPDFRSALEVVLERTGTPVKRLGEAAEGNYQVIMVWLRGESTPSQSSFPFIERIEKVLGLAPRTLTSRINPSRSKRFRKEDYPEFILFEGKQVKVRNNDQLLIDLRPLLPGDFDARPMHEREEMVTWLYANLIQPTTDWRRMHRAAAQATYMMKFLPPTVAEEWGELVEFKCAKLAPLGMSRNGTWSKDTVNIRHSELLKIMSALTLPEDAPDPRRRGLGLNPDDFSLAMLACPKVLHWWVRWMGARRFESWKKEVLQKSLADEKHGNDEEGLGNSEDLYSLRDAGVLIDWAALVMETDGWLRQRPDLADKLKPIPGLIDHKFIIRAKGDWDAVCDEAYASYMELAEAVEESAEKLRDPFEPILPIINAENPFSALRVFAQNIYDDRPDQYTAPVKMATHMRNYIIVRLCSATALRSKNLRELTYRTNNTGHLRREGAHWVIEIPYRRFKNWRSSFFGFKRQKENYRKILVDEDGLYDCLEEYLTVHRPTLLKTTKSEILFVASSENPMFGVSHFYTNFQRLTMIYLAENPYLGRGIKGVKPFGPHGVRDITATHIVKETGSLELAASSIQDAVRTVRAHYIRFLPKDKIHLADKILNAAYRSPFVLT